MIFNVTGGGGAALNFKVVAYASEDALPATAAENTIAVITDTAITSYIFSAEEPSPATAGMVWIQVGASSPVEFNALKKNTIQVYPLRVKQYVDGAWVAKTAKSYQNGVWQNWQVYLFKDGVFHPSLTYDLYKNASVTSDGLLKMYAGSVANSSDWTCMWTTSKFDYTPYKKLKWTVNVVDSYVNYGGLGIGFANGWTNTGSYASACSIGYMRTPQTTDGFKEYEMDISGIDGAYILEICGYAQAYVKEIWLEQ